MPLSKDEKAAIVKEYQVHEADTGSPEVQVALLSKRVDQLIEHLKAHQRDEHSRRGLIKLVGQRRRHLDYLSRKDRERYGDLITRLDLRR